MSDSELSEASATPVPPDRELEKSLRREVVKAQKQGVEFSYNFIRAASETSIGLTPGFYKSHAEWKQRSKDVIDNQLETEEAPPSSPEQPKSKPKPRPKPKDKPKPKEPAGRSKKRASPEKEPVPRKRQKVAAKDHDASEDLSSPLSDIESDLAQERPKKKQPQAQRKNTEKPRPTNPPKSSSGKKAKAAKSESEEEDEDEEESHEPKNTSSTGDKGTPAADVDDGSDSELSVLLDEAPPPNKKSKSKDAQKPKPKKTAKGKPDADGDPDQAEIKRLQGWLVKCGIRKLWGKELKPYETPKAKIKHLKEMLADAGMTGRYSIEKANQIKEARELAADIEAVQEGAERWGAEGDEDQDGKQGSLGNGGGAAGGRRLVRGAKNYDFLSSDGEETD